MRLLSSLGTTRLTQSTGGLRLNESVARYCPGFFAGNSFGTFGQMKVNLEGSIAPRAGTVGLAYAGNGTTNCAVVPWSGINLNTRPEMTWVLLYKKNAKGTQQTHIAGLGSTSGSAGNTLFRFVGGVNSANAVRIQAQDSNGNVFFNIDSSDFGADDLRYHCVVVSGKVDRLGDGGGLQYYADGRKLNFAPSENGYGPPDSTLFNIVTLLGARRGGVLTGADGNYDIALFVPLFGIRQSDAWCQSVSQNPWQLFETSEVLRFVPNEGTPPVTPLNAEDCAQVNTSSSVVVLQQHILGSGTDISAQTSTGVAITRNVVLAGLNCTQSNNANTVSISQTAVLAGSSCTQANSSSAGVIIQNHLLVVANSTSIGSSSSVDIIRTIIQVAENCTQQNTSTTGSIHRTINLVAENCTQVNSSSTVSIGGNIILVAANCTSANACTTGPALVQVHLISSVSQQNANSTSVAVAQRHVVVSSTNTQNNTSDAVGIQRVLSLSALSCVSTGISDTGNIHKDIPLVVASSTSNNISSTGEIALIRYLEAANSNQFNLSSNVPISLDIRLEAAECTQYNTSHIRVIQLEIGTYILQEHAALVLPMARTFNVIGESLVQENTTSYVLYENTGYTYEDLRLREYKIA